MCRSVVYNAEFSEMSDSVFAATPTRMPCPLNVNGGVN
jgi:hypothetical protein